jgi:uncharacterized phage-associated protein
MATLNEEKYRNAILYFVERISNGTLGKVKLMKLLYYLDFDYYEQYGRLVTGDTYRALPLGPVPATAKDILRSMQTDEWLVIGQRDIGLAFPQTEYRAVRRHDVNVFSSAEVEMLFSVAEKWEHHSAHEMVLATHGEPTWRYTGQGEVIDPRLVYLREFSSRDEDETSKPLRGDLFTLTREEAELRARALASARRTAEYARAHPEYGVALQDALDSVAAGEYDTFDQAGWHDH